jgi:hypothetical protein
MLTFVPLPFPGNVISGRLGADLASAIADFQSTEKALAGRVEAAVAVCNANANAGASHVRAILQGRLQAAAGALSAIGVVYTQPSASASASVVEDVVFEDVVVPKMVCRGLLGRHNGKLRSLAARYRAACTVTTVTVPATAAAAATTDCVVRVQATSRARVDAAVHALRTRIAWYEDLVAQGFSVVGFDCDGRDEVDGDDDGSDGGDGDDGDVSRDGDSCAGDAADAGTGRGGDSSNGAPAAAAVAGKVVHVPQVYASRVLGCHGLLAARLAAAAVAVTVRVARRQGATRPPREGLVAVYLRGPVAAVEAAEGIVGVVVAELLFGGGVKSGAHGAVLLRLAGMPVPVTRAAHVFVDNSNLHIGAQQAEKTAGGAAERESIATFDYSALAAYIERGGERAIAQRVVAGIMPQAVRQRWQELGYRVKGGSLHSDTDRVANIDEFLHAQILVEVAAGAEPAHLVLVTGDGNANRGNSSFPLCCAVAMRCGWSVEVVAWRASVNAVYPALAALVPGWVQVRFLDDAPSKLTRVWERDRDRDRDQDQDQDHEPVREPVREREHRVGAATFPPPMPEGPAPAVPFGVHASLPPWRPVAQPPLPPPPPSWAGHLPLPPLPPPIRFVQCVRCTLQKQGNWRTHRAVWCVFVLRRAGVAAGLHPPCPPRRRCVLCAECWSRRYCRIRSSTAACLARLSTARSACYMAVRFRWSLGRMANVCAFPSSCECACLWRRRL